jgi:hypothetical protein
MAAAPPLPYITGVHLPMGYSHYKPPILHFGWSFDPEALVRWAAENGIDTTKRYQSSADSPVVEEHDSVFAVVRPEPLAILAKEAGTPHLKLMFNLGIRSGGFHLLTISSNYNFLKDKKSISQRHIDTLDEYLKTHKIVQDSPGWHIDYEHHTWRRIY